MGCSLFCNAVFIRRFYRQLRIIMPSFCSKTTFLFIALLIIVLAELLVVFQIGTVPSHYFVILMDRDVEEFWIRTAKSMVVVIAMASVLTIKKFTWVLFYIKSREALTKAVHRLYMDDINFYRLNVLDDVIDNVDQRITQDVEKICKTFGEILPDLLVTPFNIAYYSYITWLITGFSGPVSVYVFFLVSSIINTLLMSPLVTLTKLREFYEGEFRYKHTHLRVSSEAAAFYRCGQAEKVKIEEKFEGLMAAQKKFNVVEIFLSLSVFTANYFGTVLSYAVLAVPIFAGWYDHMPPSELSSLISKGGFLIIYLTFNFTRLINMAPEVSAMAGCSHRVGELLDALDRMEEEKNCASLVVVVKDKTSVSEEEFKSMAYSVRDVDVAVSRKACTKKLLCQDLNLEITAGRSLLITGDSGTGKTSLLRTLDGLWPPLKGSIERMMAHGRGGVFYLPQKPYLTNGSLRDQIIFPDVSWTSAIDHDEEILIFLKVAGLEDLLHRTGGMDVPVDWHWEDVLSPGEAQRLAFVRLFYHRPAIAILDEATSQITEPLEKILYEHSIALGMTLISIGHRATLERFHDQKLHLLEDGSWRLEPLSNAQCPVAGRDCPLSPVKKCQLRGLSDYSKFDDSSKPSLVPSAPPSYNEREVRDSNEAEGENRDESAF